MLAHHVLWLIVSWLSNIKESPELYGFGLCFKIWEACIQNSLWFDEFIIVKTISGKFQFFVVLFVFRLFLFFFLLSSPPVTFVPSTFQNVHHLLFFFFWSISNILFVITVPFFWGGFDFLTNYQELWHVFPALTAFPNLK